MIQICEVDGTLRVTGTMPRRYERSPYPSFLIVWPLTIFLILTLAAQTSQGQTVKVLYAFRGGIDGSYPSGDLAKDVLGNVYGTTEDGGDSSCSLYGCGTVFEVSADGRERIRHSFEGFDGSVPISGLIRDALGNLYGTTYAGGDFNRGTIFEISVTGTATVLHSFSGPDWMSPIGGLVHDSLGNLYGTTFAGGNGFGTVFRLNADRTFETLYTFNGSDGSEPEATLTIDSFGNLFGTTTGGGTAGRGTVFKIDQAGSYTILHNFKGIDGRSPSGSLIEDAAGNLFGTSREGGDFSCDPPKGCGTVFEIRSNGKGKRLHVFTSQGDGSHSLSGLTRDSDGNLYGTTSQGGAFSAGAIFKLDKTGAETILHSFTGGIDGGTPYGNLLLDSAGSLFGTTQRGGDDSCNCGTVFEITP